VRDLLVKEFLPKLLDGDGQSFGVEQIESGAVALGQRVFALSQQIAILSRQLPRLVQSDIVD
jgi:hypothetical protein